MLPKYYISYLNYCNDFLTDSLPCFIPNKNKKKLRVIFAKFQQDHMPPLLKTLLQLLSYNRSQSFTTAPTRALTLCELTAPSFPQSFSELHKVTLLGSKRNRTRTGSDPGLKTFNLSTTLSSSANSVLSLSCSFLICKIQILYLTWEISEGGRVT